MFYERSIKDLYEDAIKLKNKFLEDELVRSTPEYQQLQYKSFALLTQCAKQVAALGLYSENEELMDIATDEIQYLNIDFHLADLLERTYINPDRLVIIGRVRVVKATIRKHLDFLIRLARMRALKFDTQLLDEMHPRGFYAPVDLKALLRHPGNSEDRQTRMDSYRHVRAARTRYEKLMNAREEHSAFDEEFERDLRRAELIYNTAQAWDTIKSNARELEMLDKSLPPDLAKYVDVFNGSFIPTDYETVLGINFNEKVQEKMDESKNPKLESSSNLTPLDQLTLTNLRDYHQSLAPDMSTRVDLGVPSGSANNGRNVTQTVGMTQAMNQGLIDSTGRVLRPFTLAPRDQIARGVQGYGQYGPTMSVEEFAEYEIANAARPPPQAPEVDTDAEHHVDSETYRQRQWDEFVEANPRGSGNTMNRG